MKYLQTHEILLPKRTAGEGLRGTCKARVPNACGIYIIHKKP